jgi:hypothetical protein
VAPGDGELVLVDVGAADEVPHAANARLITIMPKSTPDGFNFERQSSQRHPSSYPN